MATFSVFAGLEFRLAVEAATGAGEAADGVTAAAVAGVVEVAAGVPGRA
jgi:hypothetical protein